MNAIWKFPVPIVYPINSHVPYSTGVRMPRGARPYSIDFQGNRINVWALVRTDDCEETEELQLFLVPTGAEFDIEAMTKSGFAFVKTIINEDGTFVLTVFAKMHGCFHHAFQ